MTELPALFGLFLVALFLFLNGLFVAAEFAYVTVRRSQMEHMADEGNRRAGSALRALGNLDYYVAASQLGITMASIALGYLGEPVVAHLIEPPVEDLVGSFAPAISHGVAIGSAFILITALHIVFGEFVPKSIALQKPGGAVLWLTYPMTVFVWIFGPLIAFLNGTGNFLLRLMGFELRPIGEGMIATEDLAMTLESSATAGLISRRELDLARNALTLTNLTAADLMVPRNEVIGIPLDATTQDVLDIFAEHRHTRYPVYDGDLDNVVGVLNAKDLVLGWSGSDEDWRSHIHEPLVLPDSVKIEHAFSVAQSQGETLIVLVDEFGGTSGIVSVFDIIEFLAGDLPDEFAQADRSMQRRADGSYVLSGLMHLADLEVELNLDLPDVEAHTIGGLVMEYLERIPEVGDEVRVNGYLIRVLGMDGNRVDEVLLMPMSDRLEREVIVDE